MSVERQVAAALVAVLAAGGVYTYRLSVKNRTPIHSVTALPFIDLTPRREHQWFAEGITGEITDALVQVPGLHVVARDAEAVLEGRVYEAGGRVRLSAELKRTADGYKFWSQTFDRPMSGVIAVEQDIAAQIVKRVPSARGWHPRKLRHQASGEAYQAYLEGRSWFGRGGVEALRKAIERFEKATQVDPLFAQAWAWLSISKTYLVEEDAEPPNTVMPGARDAAERGATLDPDLSETHAAVGMVMLQYDWNWEGAKRELDRAVELNPGSPLARRWRARWDEAMGGGDKVPGTWSARMAQISVEDARDTLRRVEELRTTRFTPADTFAMAAAKAGDIDAFFEWANVAFDERSPHLPYWRLVPGLPVSDPRFQELMQKMNLPNIRH